MNKLKKNWDDLYAMAEGQGAKKYGSKNIFSFMLYSMFALWIINIWLPFVLNDSLITECQLCNNFTSMMTFVIPGIELISKESNFPTTMALQIALSWIIIIVLVMILLFNREIDSGFKSLFGLKSFLIIFIWVLNEFVFGLVISYFHGVGFDLHGTKTGLLHFLVQYKIGVGILISFMIFYEVVLLAWFASYCKIILKNLFRGK